MTGSGTLLDPYIIYDVDDLQAVSNDVLAYYRLANDIEAAATEFWNGGDGFLPIEAPAWPLLASFGRPNGVDSSTGTWTPYPADPATLYDKVNEEITDNDASYITTASAASIQFTLGDLSPAIPGLAKHFTVTVRARSKRIGSAVPGLRAAIKVGGTVYQHSYLASVGTSYQDWGGGWNFNPATNNAWTREQLMGIGENALEAVGFIVTGTTIDFRCTTVWLQINTLETFQGELDGNGYTIRNLFITPGSGSGGTQGLFSGAYGSIVKNLTLENCHLHASGYSNGMVTGYDYGRTVYDNIIVRNADITDVRDSGGLIGSSYPWAGSSALDALTVTNCRIEGGIVRGYSYLGGLIGWFDHGYIRNCSSSATVMGYGFACGGLIGWQDGGLVEDCEAMGDILPDPVYGPPDFSGGFVGWAWAWSMYPEQESVIRRCRATGDIYAYEDSGGFIGWASDYLGPVNIYRCYATGTVYGKDTCRGTLGGFVGYNDDANIEQCFSTGDVYVDEPHDFWCNFLGGFVGANAGFIKDCYARGAVRVLWPDPDSYSEYFGSFCGGNWNSAIGCIVHCYGTGLIELFNEHPDVWDDVGGFCGYNWGAEPLSFDSCYWDTQTTGLNYSDGGTGRTTAEMKTQATFVDWDFDTIWGLYGHCNDGYPCLQDVTPYCALIPDGFYGILSLSEKEQTLRKSQKELIMGIPGLSEKEQTLRKSQKELIMGIPGREVELRLELK